MSFTYSTFKAFFWCEKLRLISILIQPRCSLWLIRKCDLKLESDDEVVLHIKIGNGAAVKKVDLIKNLSEA